MSFKVKKMSFKVKKCCICEYLFNYTEYPCCSKCYLTIEYKKDKWIALTSELYHLVLDFFKNKYTVEYVQSKYIFIVRDIKNEEKYRVIYDEYIRLYFFKYDRFSIDYKSLQCVELDSIQIVRNYFCDNISKIIRGYCSSSKIHSFYNVEFSLSITSTLDDFGYFFYNFIVHDKIITDTQNYTLNKLSEIFNSIWGCKKKKWFVNEYASMCTDGDKKKSNYSVEYYLHLIFDPCEPSYGDVLEYITEFQKNACIILLSRGIFDFEKKYIDISCTSH